MPVQLMTATALEQTLCRRHADGDGPCLVLANHSTYGSALAWARMAAAHERTRFLVRFDADWQRRTGDGWEAIQTWLRTM